MKITRISQRRDNDCGVAALAMACGVDYDAILPILSEYWSDKGINDLHVKDWLINNGWAWQEVTMFHPVKGKYEKHDPWPPRPFAPSHIAQVIVAPGAHFTVMDSSGEVFDPWNAARKTLDHADYKQVNWVMGLWRVNAVVGGSQQP